MIKLNHIISIYYQREAHITAKSVELSSKDQDILHSRPIVCMNLWIRRQNHFETRFIQLNSTDIFELIEVDWRIYAAVI